MLYESIAVVALPVSDLDAACAPFERLGLVVAPPVANAATGVVNRKIPVGGPDNPFLVELLSGAPLADGTVTPAAARARSVADRGLSRIYLRVANLDDALGALAAKGVEPASRYTGASDVGSYEIAILPDLPDAATPLALVQLAESPAALHARFAVHGEHALGLERLDHLAAVAPDLERSCRFWEDVLGVPTVGEVVSPVVVVRQLKIGDAMFELLGPASPDSPIRQRPPGLNSMCSFEVADLDAAVAHARAAGFDVPDARIGTLPGTRVTTIPAEQASGLNVQLLQYV